MPEYLSPGVYVEEIPSGPAPIQGVSTSTAGFVGQTERGPTVPRLLTSWGDYLRWYGGTIDSGVSYLPFAVRGFFDNGGQRLFLARITRSDAVAASRVVPTSNGSLDVVLSALGPGDWGNRLFIKIVNGSQTGFRMTILYYVEDPPTPFVDPTESANIGDPNRREPDSFEDYDDLGFEPTGRNFFINRLNSSSQLVHLAWSDPTQTPARPNDIDPFGQLTDVAGDDGTAAISAPDYLGDPTDPPGQRTGLTGLESIDPISLLCVPDEVHPSLDTANQTQIMNAMVNQCELLRDRFAVLNIGSGQATVQSILKPRDSTYAAVYYPWVRVFDPRTLDTLLVPPGGHVTGVYARTDIDRGVHKAPANAVLRGIVNRDINSTRKPLEFLISKREHDILNPRGINVIRDFRADGRGIRVWGARTVSSDPLWRYVNVRRLFLFVEESVDEGTQWVVFEPNDEPLWARVRQSIRNFLLTVWRSGALQGATEEEAFFVRCDRTTMTQDDIDNGRLICVIGIAPVKPAEFVIFRFMQKTLNGAE